ncbi:MAG: copper chaperone PCu(A)C [Myxococcota bacterium]|nr:copper chaperone PCu(A)C [Myxococcota bacterium]
MRSSGVALFFVTSLLLWAQPLEAGELFVEEAWVRLPPPQSTAAAFMKIHNGTEEAVVLVGAQSPWAERVEIHRSVLAEGVATMEELETVSIPAGETLILAPKGMHLMLFQPKKLTEGAQVPLELKFKTAEKISTRAEVRRGPAGKHGGGGHHSHH